MLTRKTNGACYFRSARLWGAFVLVLISISWLVLVPVEARAQIGSAAINGTVQDPSHAVIPHAKVMLHNTATGVTQATTTNSSGIYFIRDVQPGNYTLEVSKTGFETAKQQQFTLNVDQTATFNFTLQVGQTTQSVEVSGVAPHVNFSTAGLGSLVNQQAVNNLPLNGRDFTQLLTLSPGVSPINTDQNGGGWLLNPVGSFSFPAVNGGMNRSNMFYVDGVTDYGSFLSTYGVAPILDTIQEFKNQTQSSQAQFGQAVGAIVNVVTKSGTNQFHGDLWDFLRNNVLDARNFFNYSGTTPLKQNMFGGTIGGPVILPGYNGRNRTFFFLGYEGTQIRSAAENLYLVPTAAELNGNLSDIGQQIYNPFSTRPDPNNTGEYIRDPFMCDSSGNPMPVNSSGMQATGTPCNIIPSTMLDPGMEYFAKTLFPKPVNTGVPGFNGFDNTPNSTSQNEVSLRIDEHIGTRNRFFVRYTGLAQTIKGSGGFVGLAADDFHHGYNGAASWTHTFGSASLLQLEFGRTSVQDNAINTFLNAGPDFSSKVGFAANYNCRLIFNRCVIPSITIDGYLGGGEIDNWNQVSNMYEFKGDFSKIIGPHMLQMGASFNTNNVDMITEDLEQEYSVPQTSNLETGMGGSALASFLLSVPSPAGWRGNQVLSTHHNWVDGFYFQDTWRATHRLTVDLGLRYDMSLWGPLGSAADKNLVGGNWDFNTGTYVITQPVPACSSTQGAPCMPGGTLPAHVVYSSRKDKLLYNNYDNISPRIGLAYRLTPKTALRASYGRFFDNFPAINQAVTNSPTLWPDVGGIGFPASLNTTYVTARGEDPLHLGSGALYPAANPYEMATAFYDPHLKNAYTDDWHIGFQRQIDPTTVLTVNYVGEHGSRIPIFIPWNVATSPGPGDPQSRAPFPYATAQYYMWSWGRMSYNALQVNLAKTAKSFTYTLAYTWSKTMNECDGYYSWCPVQNVNDINADKAVAGYNLPQSLSASWVYLLPFGAGKKFSTSNRVANDLMGGWQVNGIVTLSSGVPYYVNMPNDIANLGTQFFGPTERPNLVGDPSAGSCQNPNGPGTIPVGNIYCWFNPSAFATPAPYTFGTEGRNILTSDWHRDLDLSIFRNFKITESKSLQFRAEAFNATNTPVFGVPDAMFGDPTFGQVSYTNNTERQIQFALKFYF